MKAKLFILSLVAMLAACSIEGSDTGEERQLVFEISVTVEGDSATKGVKNGWENGDVVYVFFEGNSSQYLKMTYDGAAWTSSDKDGGRNFAGLSLAPSGKKLSAVYFPSHVNTSAPVWQFDAYVFPEVKKGYFLGAEHVPYTVSSTDNIDKVSASLPMRAPRGFVQLFVADNAPQADTWLMTEHNFTPAAFGTIVPGGSVFVDIDGFGFPMPGLPATVGGEKGYYFYGILENSCRGVSSQYHFQMVKLTQWNGYSCVSAIKAKNSVTATMYTQEGETVSNAAFRLSGWQDSYFLDLGFGSVKWAIGNLQETSPYIAGPLDAGDYYMWGKTTPYNQSDYYAGNYVKTSTDAAYAKNTAWRLPSKSEAEALTNSANTQWTWVSMNSSTKEGSYLVTSKKNGLTMVMRCAGWHIDGIFRLGENHVGSIWTSTAGTADDMGCALAFNGPGSPVNPSTRSIGDCYRRMGMAIRPVMDR